MTTFDLATTDVALVRWPQEAERRAACRRDGHPVLYLVEPGEAPPFDTTELEDWARTTADSIEVHARLTTLSLRARQWTRVRPVLDDKGMIHVGRRWIGLSPIDARLMRVLVDHVDELVDAADLAAAGWDEPPVSNVLRVRLLRLRRTIEPLGLTIRNVRNQGYVLEADARRGAA
jgi:DNA-binding response OmpR family regulator